MRKKGIVAMCENDPQYISQDRLCMHMEVPKNLVAATTANQLDDVSVY